MAALIFGPDQGLVRERAETLIKSVVPNLKDPFLIADLDDGTLASDPARLFDEAAAISMLGGRRVVRVRGAGNSLAKLFERFLDDPAGDALVVLYVDKDTVVFGRLSCGLYCIFAVNGPGRVARAV